MSASGNRSWSENDPLEAAPLASRDGFYRFLRWSHILSSVLREILEDRFLGEVSPHRLTRAQFCCLKLTALNADVQVGELATCLGVSAAASSKNIDKLERLGLVRRESSAEDRRVCLLSATREGRQLVREYEGLKAERIAPVVNAVGAERLEELCDVLEQICVGLLREEHPLRGPCLRCAGYYHANCGVASVQGLCALRCRRETTENAPSTGLT